MTASLTDRYVTATVRDLDDDQRAEVERELRTTIEDMIDGRLEAGAPSRPEAERAVLTELGDPVRARRRLQRTPPVPHRAERLPPVAPGHDRAAVDPRTAGDRGQPRRAPVRRRRRDRRRRPGGRRGPVGRLHGRRQRRLLGDRGVRARRARQGRDRRRARVGPRPAARRRRHRAGGPRRDGGVGRVPRRGRRSRSSGSRPARR